jgi:hypothetical protein
MYVWWIHCCFSWTKKYRRNVCVFLFTYVRVLFFQNVIQGIQAHICTDTYFSSTSAHDLTQWSLLLQDKGLSYSQGSIQANKTNAQQPAGDAHVFGVVPRTQETRQDMPANVSQQTRVITKDKVEVQQNYSTLQPQAEYQASNRPISHAYAAREHTVGIHHGADTQLRQQHAQSSSNTLQQAHAQQQAPTDRPALITVQQAYQQNRATTESVTTGILQQANSPPRSHTHRVTFSALQQSYPQHRAHTESVTTSTLQHTYVQQRGLADRMTSTSSLQHSYPQHRSHTESVTTNTLQHTYVPQRAPTDHAAQDLSRNILGPMSPHAQLLGHNTTYTQGSTQGSAPNSVPASPQQSQLNAFYPEVCFLCVFLREFWDEHACFDFTSRKVTCIHTKMSSNKHL